MTVTTEPAQAPAVMAISAGYIEKMPRVFMPAASSNGSPKATYRKGVKA